MKAAFLVAVGLPGVVWAGEVDAQPTTPPSVTTLHIATLAPRGSAWERIFQRWASTVHERDSTLTVELVSDGLAGDEREVAAALHGGGGPRRLDGAAMTAAGLAQLVPSALAFQTPQLFADARAAEEAFRAPTVSQWFEPRFSTAGFRVLTWAHVGTMYAFSAQSLHTERDFLGATFWGWDIDAVARSLGEATGIHVAWRSISQVLPELQRGGINAALTSPLAALSLAWWPYLQHMTLVPIAQIVGAMILRNESYNGLTGPQKLALDGATSAMQPCFAAELHRQDVEALRVLREHGVEMVVQHSPFWERLFARARRRLMGPNAPHAPCELIRRIVEHATTDDNLRAAWNRECLGTGAGGTVPLRASQPAPPVRSLPDPRCYPEPPARR